jgi:hypothetical protein
VPIAEAQRQSIVAERLDRIERHIRCGCRPYVAFAAAETLRAGTAQA